MRMTTDYRVLLAFLLPFAVSCLSAHAQSEIAVPPKYIARCELKGGAAPPRGTLPGQYVATYYFTATQPASCAEAKESALLALTVNEGTGFQNYALKSGADPTVEDNYAPNPSADLTDESGNGVNHFHHQLLGGKPGYINRATHAECTAKKIGKLNKPVGDNAAEVLLEIISCPPAFFSAR